VATTYVIAGTAGLPLSGAAFTDVVRGVASLVTQQPSDLDAATPRTSLEIQDAAMVDWLRTLVIRGVPPSVVTGWQSRYHSQAHDIEGQGDRARKQVLKLPMISLSYQGFQPEPDRWVRTGVKRDANGPFYYDSGRTEVLEAPWPTPWGINYQVDIWTKTKQDQRVLTTLLYSRFGAHPTETWIVTEFPWYGRKQLYLTLESAQDTSDLEPGEDERQMRFTFTFVLHGWLFRLPHRKKTLQGATVTLIDSDPNDAQTVPWWLNSAHYTFDSNGVLLSVAENPAQTPPDRVLLFLNFDATGALVSTGP
jgi:hypothetical protein